MMMINSCPGSQQDTLPVKKGVFKDTAGTRSDSTLIVKSIPRKDTLRNKSVITPQSTVNVFTDTSSVCVRNSIADVTFYDSNNVVYKLESGSITRFPYILTEKAERIRTEERAFLIKHLRSGNEIPYQPFHDDWIILVLVSAAFLYSLARKASKYFFSGAVRFFLFRGINDPSSRDIGGLFHWQSTLLNLISFIIIALFTYNVGFYYNLIPASMTGVIFCLISAGIISAAVTLRHVICLITGSASGQREVFREYLLGIYQSYRFSGLFLFVIIILMSYTVLLPVKFCLFSGIIILCLMYFIRILRLLIIFINRNISIFYLILYLCALEILPVVVSVKYFTGHV